MKQILFILLAAISFSSQAQSHYVHYLDGSFYGVIKDNSDTFEIQHLGNIRFIKIESEVYEIIRKTELKKVEPADVIIFGDIESKPTKPFVFNPEGGLSFVDSTSSLWITGISTLQSGKIQKTKPKTKKK